MFGKKYFLYNVWHKNVKAVEFFYRFDIDEKSMVQLNGFDVQDFTSRKDQENLYFNYYSARGVFGLFNSGLDDPHIRDSLVFVPRSDDESSPNNQMVNLENEIYFAMKEIPTSRPLRFNRGVGSIIGGYQVFSGNIYFEPLKEIDLSDDHKHSIAKGFYMQNKMFDPQRRMDMKVFFN